MNIESQQQAMKDFMQMLLDLMATMPPDAFIQTENFASYNIHQEAKTFRDWMTACDLWTRAEVEALHLLLKSDIESAKETNRASVYPHFLAYCEAAMLRRFPFPDRTPPPPHPERTDRLQCNYCGAFVALFHLPSHDCKQGKWS